MTEMKHKPDCEREMDRVNNYHQNRQPCSACRSCTCGADSPKDSNFSKFFRNATPEGKEKVFLEVAKESAKQQKEMMDSPKECCGLCSRSFPPHCDTCPCHSPQPSGIQYSPAILGGKIETQKLSVAEWREVLWEKYSDKGDERFGLVKHNNTILQNILDDVSTQITLAKEEGFEEGRNCPNCIRAQTTLLL